MSILKVHLVLKHLRKHNKEQCRAAEPEPKATLLISLQSVIHDMYLK